MLVLGTKIHLGNNKWNLVHDANIYTKLVKDTTKNFISKLNESENYIKPLNIYNKKISLIRGKTEPLSDNIFEDEKDLLKELKIAKTNLLCNIINSSLTH